MEDAGPRLRPAQEYFQDPCKISSRLGEILTPRARVLDKCLENICAHYKQRWTEDQIPSMDYFLGSLIKFFSDVIFSGVYVFTPQIHGQWICILDYYSTASTADVSRIPTPWTNQLPRRMYVYLIYMILALELMEIMEQVDQRPRFRVSEIPGCTLCRRETIGLEVEYGDQKLSLTRCVRSNDGIAMTIKNDASYHDIIANSHCLVNLCEVMVGMLSYEEHTQWTREWLRRLYPFESISMAIFW